MASTLPLPAAASLSTGRDGRSDESTEAQTAPVAPADVHPSDQTATTGQTPTMTDLLREMQETNRLLRALVAQKTVGPVLVVDEATEALSSGGTTGGETRSPSPSPSPPEPDLAKAKTRQLVEDLAHAVFHSADREHLKEFRDEVILRLSSCRAHPGPRFEAWEIPPPDQLSSCLREKETETQQLHRQWPNQFDLDHLTAPIWRDAGWIRAKNDWQNGVLCAYPLLYGPDRILIPANAILDETPKADTVARKMACANLVSPGSLWLFTAPMSTDRDLTLTRLALVAAVALMSPNDDTDTVHNFLYSFCAPWNSAIFRALSQDSTGWSGSCDMSYQHTIRCFSPFNWNRSMADDDFVPYIRCHRQVGEFPTLFSEEHDWPFAERRMSVLYRWSGPEDARSFTILLLSDFPSVQLEATETNHLFTDWRDRRFTVSGGNAGYHMLQSVVHRILTFWEKVWSGCLRMLGYTVNTTLQDILSDETSNELMFDSSYARSRVYFKTLEILRIFGDAIRETGRGVQEMDPRRLLQGSFLRAGWDVRFFLKEDPATDKALWENWRALSEFQQMAEQKLLRQIAAKTEEIKSLRDGLFNATSLREASRSTTMNRYIIVFTVFTVLYPPLGFTTALFGTPLFEAEEQTQTVERFKISTIIVCVITYVLAFLLIWIAGRWDTAGSLFHKALGLLTSIWEKAKAKKNRADKPARRNSKKPPAVADDASRRMSV